MRFLFLICACSFAYGQAEFLPEPRTVHTQGVVVDATTGEPIAGAVITVTAEVPGKGTSTSKATADFAGRFQIDTPYVMHPSGGAFLVSKAGYIQQRSYSGDQLQGASGDLYVRQVVLRMLALVTISGVVVDAGGRPSPGASIASIALDKQPAGNEVMFALNDKTTDAQGRFQPSVAPGDYHVCAIPQFIGRTAKIPVAACFPSAPDYASASRVTARAGGAAELLTIKLLEVATYRIHGRIQPGSAGKSSWGANWGVVIRADPDDSTDGRPVRGPQAYLGCVNRDDSFVISGLPAGTYTLSAVAGPGVQRLKCDAKRVAEIPPFATDNCCSSNPQPPPVLYTGQRKVTFTGNLSGIVVNVVRVP